MSIVAKWALGLKSGVWISAGSAGNMLCVSLGLSFLNYKMSGYSRLSIGSVWMDVQNIWGKGVGMY